MNITFQKSGIKIPEIDSGSPALVRAVEAVWNRLSDAVQRELVDGWTRRAERRGESAPEAWVYSVERGLLPHIDAIEVAREVLGDDAATVKAVEEAMTRTLTAIREARPRSIGNMLDDASAVDLWAVDQSSARFAALLG